MAEAGFEPSGSDHLASPLGCSTEGAVRLVAGVLTAPCLLDTVGQPLLCTQGPPQTSSRAFPLEGPCSATEG